MCFRSSGFEVSLLFLETHACKMSKLMASFALVFFCWTLESLYVGCISTFGTSVLVIVCTLWVKPLLVLGLCMVTLAALLFVVRLFWLHRWSFLYLSAGNSVHLCLRRLICIACGSLIPALCDVQWL